MVPGYLKTDLSECRSCHTKLENSPSFVIHLKKCEIFRCWMCCQERTTLLYIKEHLQKSHTVSQSMIIEHLTISRNLAKLCNGLDKSETIMVGDRKKQKLGKKYGNTKT